MVGSLVFATVRDGAGEADGFDDAAAGDLGVGGPDGGPALGLAGKPVAGVGDEAVGIGDPVPGRSDGPGAGRGDVEEGAEGEGADVEGDAREEAVEFGSDSSSGRWDIADGGVRSSGEGRGP